MPITNRPQKITEMYVTLTLQASPTQHKYLLKHIFK